jgi:membrane protein YqaA with SNARE-associated domain
MNHMMHFLPTLPPKFNFFRFFAGFLCRWKNHYIAKRAGIQPFVDLFCPGSIMFFQEHDKLNCAAFEPPLFTKEREPITMEWSAEDLDGDNTVNLAWKLLTLFVLGVAELWAAAPAGVAMRLHPLLVFLVAAAGAVSGGTVVILLGERMKAWLERKQKREKLAEKRGLLYRVWLRYGVVGWGLLAPLLVGSPLGAAFGLALGAPVRRLLVWLAIGSVLWSAVFSAVSALGWSLFGH